MISVIIPAFNSGTYIKRCIDSLLNQTIEIPFELLLIDDGSTDNTVSIINKYKDERVKYFYKENGGQSSARNLGIRQATGEYLVFVDSDDYVEPDYLSVLYSLINENDLDIAMCGMNRVKGNDGQGKRFSSGFDHNFISENVEELLLSSSFVPWNKMFKKSTWGGYWYPEGMTYEDFAIIPQVMYRAKKIGYVHDILYHYYINPDSTILKREKIKKADRNILRAQRLLEESALHENTYILANFFIRRVLSSLAWSLVEYDEEDADTILKQLVKDGKERYPSIKSNIAIQNLSRARRLFVKALLEERYRSAKIIVKGTRMAKKLYHSINRAKEKI